VKRGKGIAWLAVGLIGFFFLPVSTGSAARKTEKGKAPIVWGELTGNTGCVIFGEGRKTQTKFEGVFVMRWVGVLDVIESHKYEMKQKEWKETRADLDELQKLALKDKLKLIKIPAEHTQQELEEARKMCWSTSAVNP
jgi:hypothetical protein